LEFVWNGTTPTECSTRVLLFLVWFGLAWLGLVWLGLAWFVAAADGGPQSFIPSHHIMMNGRSTSTVKEQEATRVSILVQPVTLG
jgi:hypothetical protein